MARTSSQTLGFWQFEVGLFNDMKMVDLNEKYGTLGEAVYFRILSYIASSEGYYAVLSDSLILSIYRGIGSKWIKDKRVILRIIDYCGVCGLFDVNLLSQNVITSCGIQRRWLYAKEKARAKGFTTDKFWLLDGQGCDCCTINNDKCSNNENKCSNNENKCDNNLPYISKVKKSKETPNPLQGGGEDIWKEKFFSRYTVFERKNYNDEGIDYEVLYNEFEKSSMLQKLWSFPRVVKLYPQIISGVYRDNSNEKQSLNQAINDRAERERYYSNLRSAAEEVARKNVEYVRSRFSRFDLLEKGHKKMEREIAACEIAFEKTRDISDEQKLNDAKERRDAIEREMVECVELCGLDMSDLLPRWHCQKCQDTGWNVLNGKACDCYNE